jgi:LuxR family maltose regulon positive regulatory protein
LVTGRAGSGKTVLVRSWLLDGAFAHLGACVTVDRGERDGLRFWGSVLEELRDSGVASRASGLRAPAVAPRARVDELVRRLVEKIDRLTDPALLVLDVVGRGQPWVGAHRLRALIAELLDRFTGIESALPRRPPSCASR